MEGGVVVAMVAAPKVTTADEEADAAAVVAEGEEAEGEAAEGGEESSD